MEAGTEVAVLFPKGMVSARQEKQLTTWGGNVRAFAVEGNFDDCQRLVKEAMADPELGSRRRLSSANSINVGRLLPQMTYYAWAAMEYRSRHGTDPGFIVPSGNLGNAAAATWTWRMGLPLREIVLATNANRSISAFFEGGAWKVHPTVATLATAMDVGCPSNMERLLHLFGGEAETRLALRACQVTDDEIRRVVTEGQEQWGEVWDPHTATAVAARAAWRAATGSLSPQLTQRSSRPSWSRSSAEPCQYPLLYKKCSNAPPTLHRSRPACRS
jgi:threonine synthase